MTVFNFDINVTVEILGVGDEVIGKGTHTRFIINEERFLQKALAKKQQ